MHLVNWDSGVLTRCNNDSLFEFFIAFVCMSWFISYMFRNSLWFQWFSLYFFIKMTFSTKKCSVPLGLKG